MDITSFPLVWPVGWPRNHKPSSSNFKTGLVQARDGLVKEIQLLGGRSIVISSNAVLLNDGRISARQPRIDDTGVAAYFTLNNEEKCIPCDRWIRLEDNLHAAELTVNALRGLERWGAKEIVAAAFQGFQALPASTDGVAWWRVLEVAPDASEVEIEQAYRRLAQVRHPDKGGSADQFVQLQTAMQQAKEQRSA